MDAINESEVDPQKLEAVRKRYIEEANKRLRPEGSAQLSQLAEADEERVRALAEDPWANHEALNAKKSPVVNNATYKFFVVGAGFGGLRFAARLIDQGVATPNDIRLADAAGGFGGTWYWNRFPGLLCDVESYMYLPLLEETGYIPKQKYAPGEEVRQHVVYWIAEAERRVGAGNRAIIEVTKEAEEAHTAEILKRAPFYSSLAGCTPGYFNSYGDAAKVTDPEEKLKKAKAVSWSEGTISYLDYLSNWREEGSLRGVNVEAARTQSKL